jgi:cyclopropane-fatty-acyl-phospholipid synthase
MVLLTRRFHDRTGSAAGETLPYAVEFEKGGLVLYGKGHPACTFIVRDEFEWNKLRAGDVYQAALAFIHSKFEIEGDLIAAIKIHQSQFANRLRPSLKTIAAFLWYRLDYSFRRGSSARQVQFHYDRSNEFYRAFLDSRMVYSCAYFKTPEAMLETAQLEKLEHICRKLQLSPGDRFLDIGCGWGALLLHSADRYCTFSTGCTLSPEQRTLAMRHAEEQQLTHRVSVLECDYRELSDKFDKIASVGMFEHVGPKALQGYFNKAFALLVDGGIFLNHGIVRPATVQSGQESLFLAREVFPGGELVHLTDVIRSAERAGFEVFDIENLRPHYALTCRAWVERLRANRSKCLECVSLRTYRTWLLYLTASAASFESGHTEIHQALFVKRGTGRPLTRDYIYSR